MRSTPLQNEILKELIADSGAQLDAVADDSWSALLQPLADAVSLEEAERLIDEKLGPKIRELQVDLATVTHH